MKAFVAAGLLVLLTACTSTLPKPAAPPPTSRGNTPVTLSDADRAAIEAGTRAALNGANATFRTMIGTRGGDGVVTVCGYVNTGSGDKPYIGVLADAGFSVSSIAATREEIIAVHGSCGQKGIHI